MYFQILTVIRFTRLDVVCKPDSELQVLSLSVTVPEASCLDSDCTEN